MIVFFDQVTIQKTDELITTKYMFLLLANMFYRYQQQLVTNSYQTTTNNYHRRFIFLSVSV